MPRESSVFEYPNTDALAIASGTGMLVRNWRRLCTKSRLAAEDSGNGVTHCVMGTGKDTSSATRATMAGLKTFCPTPPNTCLPMMMAMKPPSTATHQGAQGGRLIASSQPVSSAEPSSSVALMRLLPISLSATASNPRHERMVSAHRKKDCQPNNQNPNSVAGTRAIFTRSIVCETEFPPCACGEATNEAARRRPISVFEVSAELMRVPFVWLHRWPRR